MIVAAEDVDHFLNRKKTMLTKTELYFAYQRETGLGLDTIKNIKDYVDIEMEAECKECKHQFDIQGSVQTEGDLIAYVEWLENLILVAANAGKIKL